MSGLTLNWKKAELIRFSDENDARIWKWIDVSRISRYVFLKKGWETFPRPIESVYAQIWNFKCFPKYLNFYRIRSISIWTTRESGKKARNFNRFYRNGGFRWIFIESFRCQISDLYPIFRRFGKKWQFFRHVMAIPFFINLHKTHFQSVPVQFIKSSILGMYNT